MSGPWIKICGLLSADAIDAALSCEVDAIGFVFAASLRRIEPDRAALLAAPARGRVRCVAVMRHASQAELDSVLAEFRPDVLQTDIEDFAALELPAQLERLPVVRAGHRQGGLPKRLLFEGPASGSGLVTDWDEASRLASGHQVILAGGLDPVNVSVAIERVRPFGVDVSSGVELRPGIKSVERIVSFVAAARSGCRRTEVLAR